MGFKIYSDGTDWVNLSESLDVFFNSNTTVILNEKDISVNYFDMKVGDGEGNYYE